VDGIPPLLIGSVDVFVPSGGITTLALVLGMWESLTTLLYIELGLGWV
jgi:hypothetical protein